MLTAIVLYGLGVCVWWPIYSRWSILDDPYLPRRHAITFSLVPALLWPVLWLFAITITIVGAIDDVVHKR